jgi:hypothetical protein
VPGSHAHLKSIKDMCGQRMFSKTCVESIPAGCRSPRSWKFEGTFDLFVRVHNLIYINLICMSEYTYQFDLYVIVQISSN